MSAAPISFVYRNLVFGREPGEAWAVFRLGTRSYAGLSRGEKLELLGQIAGFAEALEADFTLLRVSRAFSLDSYTRGAQATVDSRHGHPDLWARHLDAHRAGLSGRECARPEVYLSVRVAGADERGVTGAGPAAWLRSLGRLVGLRDAAGISRRRLEALLAAQARMQGRLLDYVDAEPAQSHELEWLIRRAFTRGLGEPELDEQFLPQALVVEAGDDEGGLRYEPLEADLLRLFDSPITVERRSLRIDSELGESHQALLVLGALPERLPFPDRRAELLFAPVEALSFAVDVAFHARHVPNERAVALVRRKVVDAENMLREEEHGEYGASHQTELRPLAARELERYLTSADHPPLLRAQVSLCVSARTREQLEARVERLRREYGSIKLHRPLGEQLRLFVSHLPGQANPVCDYDDYMLVEQFGAMVPLATHHVGSDAGPYVGHTLSGSAQPVLFDLTEASRTARPPAVLCSGTLGSGKTLTLELLLYQAFLAGSRIVDIDPKGDHRLHLLPGVAEHCELIELTPAERHRGMLDPLRIGPDDTRSDLAHNFLTELLPPPVPAGWQTELRVAIEAVLGRGGRSCGLVVKELEQGNDDAREAARALAVHACSGLLRLGFADPDGDTADAGAAQVTSLRIQNLTLPLPGTSRADLSTEERTGQALLRLLATYALHLAREDWSRHKALGFDEAWMLLGDSAGRALVQRINRLGRSQNATPILATQALGDVSEMENLIGACFCFGVETDDEARRALTLLRLDADDERLRQQLVSFRRGRCLLRDYEGRVSPVQVDLADPQLLAALDTTPTAPGDAVAA